MLMYIQQDSTQQATIGPSMQHNSTEGPLGPLCRVQGLPNPLNKQSRHTLPCFDLGAWPYDMYTVL
jgi:hypothetical protein